MSLDVKRSAGDGDVTRTTTSARLIESVTSLDSSRGAVSMKRASYSLPDAASSRPPISLDPARGGMLWIGVEETHPVTCLNEGTPK